MCILRSVSNPSEVIIVIEGCHVDKTKNRECVFVVKLLVSKRY